MAGGPRAALTKTRDAVARAIAAAVDWCPSIEPAFVRIGRAVHVSYPLATLYYHAHTDLTERLRGSGRRFRPMSIDGVAMDVDISDHSARLRYFEGVAYEPEVTRQLIAGLAPGDVCIDVGANAGFFTTLAALCVGPSGRVVAFEPHPGARAALQALIAHNGVADRVDVISAAAGSCSAPAVALHLSGDPVLSTLVPEQSPLRADFAFDRSIHVPLTTIDAWTDSHPAAAPRIAVIKIDVEGFESEVIAGWRRPWPPHPGRS